MKKSDAKMKLFREVMVALVVCGIADILGGSFLGIFEDYLIAVPGILLMIPPTMGLRGNVYGALAARFSTSLHLGTATEESVKEEFFTTMGEILFLSFFIPIFALIASKIMGFRIANYFLLTFVMVFTAFFSGAILTALTVFIAKFSHKCGWDPDNVTAPFVTTAGDIITIPTIFLGVFLALMTPLIAQLIVILISLIILIRWFFRRAKFNRITIILICAMISGIGGIILETSVFPSISGTAVVFLIPVFMDEAGNVSSVFSSRMGTDYHLGILNFKKILRDALTLLGSVVLVFLLIAILSLPISSEIALQYSPSILVYVVFVGFMVSLVGILFGPLVAISSIKLGANPDDVTIPIITSMCDALSSLVLYLTLSFVI